MNACRLRHGRRLGPWRCWLLVTGILVVGCASIGVFYVQPSRSAKRMNLDVKDPQELMDHPNGAPPHQVLFIESLDKKETLSSTDPKSAGSGTRKGANDGFNCPPIYGRIDIFVAVVTESYKNFYGVAQATLRCYLASHNYRLRLVDLSTDKRVAQHCSHNQLFFRKHCAASVYLEDADWLLVLDADAGVVNPAHCLEEYIDENVDLIFYERFFNWEVASGNYFVKNSSHSKRFLRKWADYQYEQPKNWNGADNGVLQMLLLQEILPNNQPEHEMCDKVWRLGTNYETYMRFVMCVKVALGSRRVWPHIKIFRRAHGWVYDWFMTNDKWCQRSFMLHGWKSNQIGAAGWNSPFTRKPNDSDCEANNTWPWREERRVSCDDVKKMLKNSERSHARTFASNASRLPFLEETDIGDCWPDCKH